MINRSELEEMILDLLSEPMATREVCQKVYERNREIPAWAISEAVLRMADEDRLVRVPYGRWIRHDK